ncbi:C-C motif chemokine 20 [Bombina bombina]|uniref:C-C motif chemokine 20 n=1 Tax=Bombina bombina TaxID=8345 RepID=UPI00235AD202|nr:C-C motif chemokine 20 [Bombina bombina]
MSGIYILPLLCVLALYLTNTVGAFPPDCCYSYTKKPLPLKVIKGFTMQRSYEVCDIDAVIFITRKFRVCANPDDPWVIKAVKDFSLRRRKYVEKYLTDKTNITKN